MKFKISRHELANIVSKAVRAVAARPAVPVMAGMKLTATGDGLTARGSDYDQTVTATGEANVFEPGEVVVFGRLLADIAKALPQGDVLFELDGNRVNVEAGRAKFQLIALPADEYPGDPVLPETVTELDLDVLETAVSRVAVAATRDQTLPLLTCVNMSAEHGELTMSATDRYRLAVDVLEWDDGEFEALIPAAGLVDAVKVLTGPVRVGVSGRQVAFSTDTESVVLTMFDGDYPPVLRLFPKDTGTSAKVDRDALIGAVKRVSLALERNIPIRLAFTPGSLTVSGGTGDDTQATETLEAAGRDNIETAYNPQFLLDGLANLVPGDVVFDFTEPMKPAVLHQGGAYRYLVMPVRPQ